ncbi:uncharacterized protein PFLUO_LOCUS3613 [Penicillium psychrofluorescens]|uniref:uncharacterized protein n=1 Tax=Penicillium psychrofluorescens TaxID=3158075 RepID=UPI003CCD37D0
MGETGSGKSTQIPQMVLDQAIRRQAGAEIRVLCVQPRRIAASSLAQRVAHERGEKIGDTVGFQVRFESHWPRTGGAITYCTTGIMLNLLQTSPQFLHSFSHIMLDEIHVRDVGIDFVMLLLKRLISQRQALGHSAPKVIVMSATLDVDLFSSYFSNKGPDGTMTPAPHLIIPGRSFPVEKHYLDEILQSLIRLYGSSDALAQFFNNPDTKYETSNYLLQHYKHFSSGPPSDVALVLESLKATPNQFRNASSEYEDPLIPYELLLATIVHILSTRDTGSVLVFLPGMKHILMVEEMLRSRGPGFGFSFSDENRFQILALHALLPEGQKNIAMEVPTGCRRILLATDIAEASVTFPDVKFVVDCGKAHEAVFDSKSLSRRLACSWISKSSAIQRAGRAGRVQPGEYFALYTEERHDGFRVTKSPEITRMDLQDVCLRAMVCAPDVSVTELLQEAIESPDIMNVQAAMDSLRRLQAVDENDTLTHLGHILSQLSIDPARAKLVILGIIFRCLDPLLIHGAMAESSLFRFQSTPDGKAQVVHELQSFAQASGSDHIGLINAFKAVRDVYMRSGRWKALDFCVKHCIHFPRYHETYLVSREILGKLSSAGLIRPDQASLDESYQFGGPELNANSRNPALIKALLLHCMYPQIAVPSLAPSRLRSPYCDTETDRKTVINRGSSILRIPSTDPKQKYMRVQSLFVFSKKVEVGLDGVSFKALFDTSLIDPLTACLFGGRLQWNGQNISMGSCVNIPVLSADGRDDQGAHGVIELRKAVDRSLAASYQYLVMQQQNRSHRGSHSAREAHFSALSKAIKEIIGLELHQLSSQKDVREEINVY